MATKKKKTVKAKKLAKKIKGTKKAKAVKKVKIRKPKITVLGKVDHFYDKISVVTFKVKNPFKVGDVIHVQGHTTDLYQRVESIQIYHDTVAKAKKGDEVGIKLKTRAREHDIISLATEQDLAQSRTLPLFVGFSAPAKPVNPKPAPQITAKPVTQPTPPPPPPTIAPKPAAKPVVDKKPGNPYDNVKFLKF
ncbi:MAG: hypothetical protein NT099_09275 [Candidatus Saganbacteria bacterium]|nr:hypothetical protein [Candidatus Saganbacteria bacterium]